MAPSNGNESSRDARRRTERRDRRWQKIQKIAKQLAIALISGGLLAPLLVALIMYIVSNPGNVVNAQTSQQVGPNMVSMSGEPFNQSQPAGAQASVILSGNVRGVLLPIAKTSSAPAHIDAGMQIDATCAFTASGVVGTVISFSESQRYIIDDQTGAVALIGLPAHSGSTNYFWQMETDNTPQIIALPNHEGFEIIESTLVTRFTRGATPVGSFQLNLIFTITNQALLCDVEDP